MNIFQQIGTDSRTLPYALSKILIVSLSRKEKTQNLNKNNTYQFATGAIISWLSSTNYPTDNCNNWLRSRMPPFTEAETRRTNLSASFVIPHFRYKQTYQSCTAMSTLNPVQVLFQAFQKTSVRAVLVWSTQEQQGHPANHGAYKK